MSAIVRALLAELKDGLRETYGERLCGVYLYGSYARGEEDSESDLDVLVVLDRIDGYAAEIDRTGPLASQLSLKYGVSISRVFLPEAHWLKPETAFLANARDEAIAA